VDEMKRDIANNKRQRARLLCGSVAYAYVRTDSLSRVRNPIDSSNRCSPPVRQVRHLHSTPPKEMLPYGREGTNTGGDCVRHIRICFSLFTWVVRQPRKESPAMRSCVARPPTPLYTASMVVGLHHSNADPIKDGASECHTRLTALVSLLLTCPFFALLVSEWSRKAIGVG
jgi:hypothetical protein